MIPNYEEVITIEYNKDDEIHEGSFIVEITFDGDREDFYIYSVEAPGESREINKAAERYIFDNEDEIINNYMKCAQEENDDCRYHAQERY